MTKAEEEKIFKVMNDYQREFIRTDCQDEGFTYKIEAVMKVMRSLGIYGAWLASIFIGADEKEGE